MTLPAVLEALPHYPGDAGFPDPKGYEDRADLAAGLDVRSCFEFGGHYGFGIVTWLHTFPKITWAGWSDNEGHFAGSNTACLENVFSYLGTRPNREVKIWFCERPPDAVGIQADVVMVDGDHSYTACLVDLALARAMRPKLILVDDMQMSNVSQAVLHFSEYSGLAYETHPVAAGTAVFRIEEEA